MLVIDHGIDERRDANPQHVRAYRKACVDATEKYFARYGKERLSLLWSLTHPAFRRRGAVKMLCNWGEKVAARRGSALTVMGSPTGSLLYGHMGYDRIGTEQVEVKGDDESTSFSCMVNISSTQRSSMY